MEWPWKNLGRLIGARDEARLLEAIRRAEQGSRGEVIVHVEHRCEGGDALARAARLYQTLGMHQTAADTGVLLYVAVKDRKAAVYAGQGIHGAAEPGFWQTVVDAVAAGCRRGALVAGLESALEHLGGLLRSAAPGEDLAGNELPDRVSQA
jgi:uncharacterized membrane protein